MSADDQPLAQLGGVTEAATVAALAIESVEPHKLELGTVYAVPDGKGGVKFEDTDKYDVAPRRAKADRSMSDAPSFVGYVNRHKVPGTEVFAHVLSSSVIAVIDSHEGTDSLAGWQDHTATLDLEHSKEWLAWTEHDLATNPRGWFDQQAFAEFIEERALDVLDPDHATLIEIATKFEAKKSADFKSSVRRDNGDVQFEFVETTAAKVGEKGDLVVPKELKLALRPYIGGPRVYVFAQFRYRLIGGQLSLGYALVRPEAVLETAFSDIVTEIREGKTVTTPVDGGEPAVTRVHEGIGDVPIFYGKPRR